MGFEAWLNLLRTATLIVMADAYSGLPNPEWRLSIDQRRELVGWLTTLGRNEDHRPVVVPPLGYRGMVVLFHDPGGSEVELRVYAGRVVWDDAPTGSTSYADPDRALEAWLLSTGIPMLPRDLARRLDEAIRAGQP